eukprot:g526.t1
MEPAKPKRACTTTLKPQQHLRRKRYLDRTGTLATISTHPDQTNQKKMSEAMGILSSKAQEDTNVESKTANDASVKIVAQQESQVPDESSQQVESENKPDVEFTAKNVPEDVGSNKAQEETDKLLANEEDSEDSKPDKIAKRDEVTSEVSSEATSNQEEKVDETQEQNAPEKEKVDSKEEPQADTTVDADSKEEPLADTTVDADSKEEPQADTTVDADPKEEPFAGSKRKDSPVTKSDDSAQNKRTKVDAATKCVEDIDKTTNDEAPKDAVVA